MPQFLEGVISANEGLREALEIVITLKHVNNGILEIRSSTLNGRIGVAWGRYVTGGLIEGSDEIGKPAVRKLLSLTEGCFSYIDASDSPDLDLRQSLGIDLNGILLYIPDFRAKSAPWLYEPEELAEAFSQTEEAASVQPAPVQAARLESVPAQAEAPQAIPRIESLQVQPISLIEPVTVPPPAVQTDFSPPIESTAPSQAPPLPDYLQSAWCFDDEPAAPSAAPTDSSSTVSQSTPADTLPLPAANEWIVEPKSISAQVTTHQRVANALHDSRQTAAAATSQASRTEPKPTVPEKAEEFLESETYGMLPYTPPEPTGQPGSHQPFHTSFDNQPVIEGSPHEDALASRSKPSLDIESLSEFQSNTVVMPFGGRPNAEPIGARLAEQPDDLSIAANKVVEKLEAVIESVESTEVPALVLEPEKNIRGEFAPERFRSTGSSIPRPMSLPKTFDLDVEDEPQPPQQPATTEVAQPDETVRIEKDSGPTEREDPAILSKLLSGAIAARGSIYSESPILKNPGAAISRLRAKEAAGSSLSIAVICIFVFLISCGFTVVCGSQIIGVHNTSPPSPQKAK